MEFNQQHSHLETPSSPAAEAGHPQPVSRQAKPSVKLLGVLLIVAISYIAGFKSGEKGFAFTPKEFKIINKAEQPQTVDYQLLWDAIDVLNQKYIDKPVDAQKVLYGAIHGAAASTGDPYTDFFEPKDLENFKTDLKGSFDGIGAEIGKKDGSIVIVAPLDDSPAKKAGLLAKDIVLQVDGESTSDWSVEQAVSKIRGQKGTEVRLTIYREGQNRPFDVTIVRNKIEIKSVKWEFKEVEAGGQRKKIAIITLSRFGDDTKPLFEKAVNEILTKSVDGIVLDLRNNPGGYLQTSVDLASNWISLGSLVVTEVKSEGEPVKYNSLGNTRLSNFKTVVLINAGSASASEILSGALQDYGAATLVGEKSFGKGSVQELVDLKGGSALKVTVAKWVMPKGRNLNKEGLMPDIEVKMTDEDYANERDPQMEKALEITTNF